ncbi:hypothetical protein ASG32_27330 [Methylobacterium sp. Leaf361]|uniref:hypothetical protein n=1 Tax=Methylobacterium sp. Leaf361 TaxID=1736352 RepID=UPI0006FB8779|nr:hypothetical protein [Methylobacterium sp. Leaf361]KQS75479.1 hypothetical protein ASG32_27330 [Methylobacterium sp. Leaf361]
MDRLELIRVAAFAAASALGVFGAWLIFGDISTVPPAAGGSLILSIAAVLHPGVWYLLAAIVIRQIGRRVSR